MKSITIHKLDEVLAEGIEAKAEESGESLNMTIKKLLAQALNIDDSSLSYRQKRTGYRQFLGKWSEEDAADFAKATEDFDKIDERDWQT